MLVVLVYEQLEIIPKGCSTHWDQQTTCSLSLYRPDEPLDDRDAPMLPDGKGGPRSKSNLFHSIQTDQLWRMV